MDQSNQNPNPNPNPTPAPEPTPVEAPPVITETPPTPSHSKTLPVFIILGAFLLFVGTAAVLVYNYQYTSKAVGRMEKTPAQNVYRKPTYVPSRKATITPTPASAEEAAIESIMIDESTSDFTSIDEAASGL